MFHAHDLRVPEGGEEDRRGLISCAVPMVAGEVASAKVTEPAEFGSRPALRGLSEAGE